jgi:hypothetical protein
MRSSLVAVEMVKKSEHKASLSPTNPDPGRVAGATHSVDLGIHQIELGLQHRPLRLDRRQILITRPKLIEEPDTNHSVRTPGATTNRPHGGHWSPPTSGTSDTSPEQRSPGTGAPSACSAHASSPATGAGRRATAQYVSETDAAIAATTTAHVGGGGGPTLTQNSCPPLTGSSPARFAPDSPHPERTRQPAGLPTR